MVGFVQRPAIEKTVEELQEDRKHQSLTDSRKPFPPSDPHDFSPPEVGDLSASSYLDFESIDGWLVDENGNLCIDTGLTDLGLVTSEFDFSKEIGEMDNGICDRGTRAVEAGEAVAVERIDEIDRLEVPERITGEEILEYSVEELLGKVKIEAESDLSSVVIAEEKSDFSIGVEKVNQVGNVVGVNGSGVKSELDKNVDDESESSSDVESDGESSSSASSTSLGSSSDEQEDEMEEGEIVLSDGVDEMIAWGNDEDYDGPMGPIKSKNELEVLPPVPSVTVTLERHHQTLPVGVVLSVLGLQVIVEGVEKHSPLSEGSILWITESRLPLGIVDEIFGPVKNPFYIVRYNSETEVPAGVEQGSSISFVAEFANHILNDKSLYQKGYDASGENDEEQSENEFSDDEKEAEYKRMLKMKKRGTKESKPGNKGRDKRRTKSQTASSNSNRDSGEQSLLVGNTPQATNDKNFGPVVPPATRDKSFAPSAAPTPNVRPDMTGNPPILPPLWHGGAEGPGFSAPSGIGNAFRPQFQQSMGLPAGLPANGMLWMQQTQPFQSHQTPLPFQPQTPMPFQQQTPLPFQQQTPLPFQQQIPIPFNPNMFGGVPGLGAWTAGLDPNMLSALQFAAGFRPEQGSLPHNGGGEQTAQSQGSQMQSNSQSSVTVGQPRNFSQGSNWRGGGRRGRRHQHGGRGRFGGGRGRYESH